MSETPTPEKRASDAHGGNGASSHGLFPAAWVARLPMLAIVSAVIVFLASLGHILGGFAELSHLLFGSDEEKEQVAVEAPKPPLAMTLSLVSTRGLDGYQLVGDAVLPVGFEPGPVVPGGAKTRLSLQASDPTQVIQIDRVALDVKRHSKEQLVAFDYTFDPRDTPGFGTARPRQFYVSIKDSNKGDVYYVNDTSEAKQSSLNNVLPAETPLLVLDAHAGLQEVLDFNLVPDEPGLYEIRFNVHVTSAGHESEIKTNPIYIFRK